MLVVNSGVNVLKTLALAIQAMAFANVRSAIMAITVNKNVQRALGVSTAHNAANHARTEAYAHHLMVNANVHPALRAIFASVDALKAFGA